MSTWLQSVPPSVLESHYKADAEHVAKDLSMFGKTDALIICCKLNLLTSDGGSRKPAIGQVAAISLLQKQGILSDAWYNKLRDYFLKLGEKGEQAFAINRPALLEFMRWIACNCDEKSPDKYDPKYSGKAFVRSLLACSEFYGKREIASTLSEEGKIEDKRFKFLAGERRATMWAGSFANPTDALGRAQLLLQEHFFGKHTQYLPLFEKHFGISFDDYLTCATAIVLLGFVDDTRKEQLTSLNGCFEMHIDTVFKNLPDMKEPFNVYLSKLSQTAEALGAALGGKQDVNPDKPFDFRPLRSKPILQFDDKVIVIDQRLFIESYCAGPLFLLSRALRSETPIEDYGDACQDYSLRLLSRTNDRFEGDLKVENLISEPPSNTGRPIADIAMSSGTTIALIEAKGVWLNDDVLYETDANEFWKKILLKYGVSKDPKTGEEKRKGTAQLADLIKAIAAGELRGVDSAEFINTGNRFIPILVMQDNLMTAGSLIPYHLALEFNKLMDQGEKLPESGDFQFGEFTVHSLVPLTLHDLEVLEGIVPETAMIELFLEYSKEVPMRGDSFAAFLHNRKTPIKWLPPVEMLVKASAIKLLKSIQNEHFGAGASAK